MYCASTQGEARGQPQALILGAAHLALGVSYWDLRLIIEASGIFLSPPPCLGITNARHRPDFLLYCVSFPTVTTEPQAACLLSSPSSPSYSQSSDPGPSFQRSPVTQSHTASSLTTSTVPSFTPSSLYTLLLVFFLLSCFLRVCGSESF